jgi:hypothetical protein
MVVLTSMLDCCFSHQGRDLVLVEAGASYTIGASAGMELYDTGRFNHDATAQVVTAGFSDRFSRPTREAFSWAMFAVALSHCALASASAPGRAPHASKQEFAGFVVKFRAAPKANEAATVAGLAKLPFQGDAAVGNAAQFGKKIYYERCSAKTAHVSGMVPASSVTTMCAKRLSALLRA